VHGTSKLLHGTIYEATQLRGNVHRCQLTINPSLTLTAVMAGLTLVNHV